MSIISNVILVSNLSRNVTEAHIREIFGTFGQITDIKINIMMNTSRLEAVITYANKNMAQYAHQKMNGGCLDGILITVQFQ